MVQNIGSNKSTFCLKNCTCKQQFNRVQVGLPTLERLNNWQLVTTDLVSARSSQSVSSEMLHKLLLPNNVIIYDKLQ